MSARNDGLIQPSRNAPPAECMVAPRGGEGLRMRCNGISSCPPTPAGWCWVYLATENPTRNAKPVKVGVAADYHQRVSGLAVGNPRGLGVFCAFVYDSRAEAEAEEAAVLGAFPRLRGEWLDADPFAVVEFLNVRYALKLAAKRRAA